MRRNILFTDGADHLRLRGAVRDVFTRSFIAGLREGIDTIAADTIDSIPAGVEFDFMTDIALPLPIAVAAAWMGLDIDAARLLREESPAITRMLTDFTRHHRHRKRHRSPGYAAHRISSLGRRSTQPSRR